MEILLLSLPQVIQPLFIGLMLWQILMSLKLWLWVVLGYSGSGKYYGFEAYRFVASFLGMLIFFWAICRLLGAILTLGGPWWLNGIALSLVILFAMNLKFHWLSYNPASGLNMTGLLKEFSNHAIKTKYIPSKGLGAKFVNWIHQRFSLNLKTATLLYRYLMLNLFLLPILVLMVFFLY